RLVVGTVKSDSFTVRSGKTVAGGGMIASPVRYSASRRIKTGINIKCGCTLDVHGTKNKRDKSENDFLLSRTHIGLIILQLICIAAPRVSDAAIHEWAV